MKIPRPLILMFVLQLVQLVVRGYVELRDIDWYESYGMFNHGLWSAIDMLALAGLLELARTCPGRATGLKLAALGQGVSLAMHVSWQIVLYVALKRDADSLFEWFNYLWAAVAMITVVGMAIAARNALIAVWIALASAAIYIPLVVHHVPIYEDLGHKLQAVLSMGAELLGLGAWFVVVYLAGGEATGQMPRPGDAAAALRRAGLGQWLMVGGIAAMLLAAFAAMGHDPSFRTWAVLSLFSQVLVIVALGLFAWGCVDAATTAVEDLPAWILVLAAAAATWCAGAELVRLTPLLANALHDDWGGDNVSDTLDRTRHIVAAIAVAVSLFALAGFRARRGHGSDVGAVIYAILAGVALFARYGMEPDSEHAAQLATLFASACTVAALVFAALGLSRAGDVVAAPALPRASVRA
jgi:hypothetical protein